MNSKTNLFGIDSVRDLTKAAVVAALYIAVTMVFAVFSYGPLQFRPSEGLNNLAVFNKRYVIAITLGCFISNMVSSLGAIDMVVGTLETLVALLTINLVTRKMKNLVAKLATSVLIGTFFMFIIAFEIAFVGSTAFWPTFWSAYLTTGISEFVTMSIGAIILYIVNLKFNLSK
ncbi:QueT transporter family protein [Lentilactobacillus laojiaonis]|uniref:QueT transporter family protein n=1 Tax=Lentilactobacillus laojiaonis TaxID=2883998 RepID=UPI001D0B74E6|nr:QueT transporter family protein [Lentilactobacillus laojiaonis]UDM32186.1 QueT transporter family protein [Lentilactobacillus laojiaonis]